MAAGDTALWLHNKLGSTDDLWSGKSICSQLSREKLLMIQECFDALLSHVKVKLLLSFLHIPRRNLEQWQNDLEEIISLGINDRDPWVSTIGEVMREYPSSGSLLMVEQDGVSDSSMTVCLEEMKQLVSKSTSSMMPLECQYLNKSSLTAVAGHLPEPSKHFTIKRRPKSAALRAEIIQKSSEIMLNKRNHSSGSVPIKSRSFAKKMDTTPLRSTPGRSPLSGSDFRTPGSGLNRLNSSIGRSPIAPYPLTPRTGKKDSKIKLLELEEMPVGAKEAKRRKKIADMEALEAQKKEKEAAAAAAAANTATTTAAGTTTAPASYTPDYAAGLLAPATPKMPLTVLSVSSSLPQPSPAYLPSSLRTGTQSSTLTGIGPLSTPPPIPTPKQSTLTPQQSLKTGLATPSPSSSISITNPAAPPSSTTPMISPLLISQDQQQKQQQQTQALTMMSPIGTLIQGSSPLSGPVPITTTNRLTNPVGLVRTMTSTSGVNRVVNPAAVTSLRPQQAILVQQTMNTNTQSLMPVSQPQAATLTQQLQQPTQQQQPQQQPQQQAPAANAARKGLSLTRDQMTEAQEMFKASNKVSRPEKALILGFMAGSRENPCPQQGNILNIKLSEREEEVKMPDGSMVRKIEDTYFQMNYATGEWKRFLKVRELPLSVS